MSKISGKLTVFFEDPFWIGIFEKITDNKLSVCKVTFGSEPKDYQIYDFILKKYDNLKFSDTVTVNMKEKISNPKRAPPNNIFCQGEFIFLKKALIFSYTKVK